MNRLLPALLLGFFVCAAGLCLFFSPPGRMLEENLGLYLLFTLRGIRHPPEEVVIINLVDQSSAQADLPENVSTWPRSIYTGIVESLTRHGASVIVFDVFFSEPGNQTEDLTFAEAIRKAGNVILTGGLQQETLETGYRGGTERTVVKENLIRPIASLAEPALAVAPFPLPKFPVRVNQFWTFKTLAGEIPTLPVAALQAHEFDHYELLHKLIREKIPGITKHLPPTGKEALASLGLINILRHLRSLFLQDASLADYLLAKIADERSPDISPEDKKRLTALVRMYGGENRRYLNYYGPPGTMKMLSYSELLASTGKVLQNKVVFIGAVRKSWSEQQDGFYTVYTQPDGLDLSGVEIAATVFANLHEDMVLQPLAPEASTLFIFCCGFGAVLAVFFLPPLPAATAIIAGVAVLSVSGGHFFAVRGTWIPFITPLLFQPVLAFLSVLYWKFLNTQREKENMSKALGLYLPEKVVRELSKGPGFIKTGDQMVYSVCLQTDAQHYTTLSEKTQPKELGDLMREYYRYIFEPVRKYGGVVSDVVGDAMLAIWPSAYPRNDLRVYACEAALEILSAADRFNRKHHATVLPTRIGMHYGYMLLGNIGAESHYEYTPVGDIVNTTSRIEKLNKILNTKVLASVETIEELPEITSREIGEFLLSGKSEPIIIHELITVGNTLDTHREKLCESFRQALTLFREENWEHALHSFTQCLAICENDGPSLFYLQLCQTYLSSPPPRGRRRIVHIDT